MKKIIKNIITGYLPFVLASMVLLVGLAFAWTDPTTDPTGGNVSAPINVSADAQSKECPLGIGGGAAGTALQWIRNVNDNFQIHNNFNNPNQPSFVIEQDGIAWFKYPQPAIDDDGKLRIGTDAGVNAELCLNSNCFKGSDLLAASGGSGNPACRLTIETSNGNLGGVAGADGMCSAEFGSDYRFAHCTDVVNAWDNGVNAASGAHEINAWCQSPGASCAWEPAGGNWFSSDGAHIGPIVKPELSGQAYLSALGNCNQFYRILCCNF